MHAELQSESEVGSEDTVPSSYRNQWDVSCISIVRRNSASTTRKERAGLKGRRTNECEAMGVRVNHAPGEHPAIGRAIPEGAAHALG